MLKVEEKSKLNFIINRLLILYFHIGKDKHLHSSLVNTREEMNLPKYICSLIIQKLR